MRHLVTVMFLLLFGLVLGCENKSDPAGGAGSAAAAAAAPAGSAGPVAAAGAVTVRIAYGSEKKTWFEEQAKAFEATGPTTKAAHPIKIQTDAMGSGEAMAGILAGTSKPVVFSPAAGAYVSLLNHAWQSQPGHTKALAPAGEPLVLSPVVIAMWRPMAEALGWPAKPLGWKDLLAVSADPKGWGGKGHPEWGRFKLGHTHPEYSNSGLLSVLAEAYAGAKKTRGLTPEDLDAKPTRDFLSSVEGSVIYYGKSTGFFAEKMISRGPEYLSGAVLYENLVVESYAKPSPSGMPIVAIYPSEGTFWSDHPYSILDADWVSPEQREAAEAFLAFLKKRPAQERALALGFRPADPAVAVGAPIDEAHGVNAKEPQTLLDLPSGTVLQKLLDVWEETKKTTDVIVIFDKSGSMSGNPLAQAKAGAKAFLGMLHPRDQVTLMFFDNDVYPPQGPVTVEQGKADLTSRLDGTVASGGTALYDAVAKGYEEAQKRVKSDPNRIHALVVMTDGKDESSKLPLLQLKASFSKEDASVKIFTIAYGDGADPTILEQIAEAARGTSARGNASNIVDVYRDMASFF